MKVLITGFEPFNKEKINPSAEAVKLLPETIKESVIIKKILPTVFNESFEKLKSVIEKENPDIVICVGQAGGRDKITIERVAINVDDASIPDNKGNTPIDKIIQKDGENSYFSSLPIKAIIKNLNDNNVECGISNTAGTFVCNHIMYQSLYFSKISKRNYKTGFIHIPYIKEQVVDKKNIPFMELNKIAKGLYLTINTCIEFYNKEDINLSNGTIC